MLHDAHFVRHGERFMLIMRDQDRGGAFGAQDGAHFGGQPLAQVHIQAGKRFVEQQQARTRRQGTRQRHALLLAARQFMRILVRLARQSNQGQQFVHATGARSGRHGLQAKGDIARHAQMRKQRVILEYHADPAPLGRHLLPGPADRVAANPDHPRIGTFEARNAAQHRGLATTGGAQQAADSPRRQV